MTPHLVWIAGVIVAALGIAVHRRRLVDPDPSEMGFGTPVRDAFLNMLAWICGVFLALLGVQFAGIPALGIVALVMLGALWLERRGRLYRLYPLANWFAVLTLVFVWATLEVTLGDIPVFEFLTELTRLDSRF